MNHYQHSLQKTHEILSQQRRNEREMETRRLEQLMKGVQTKLQAKAADGGQPQAA